MVNVTYDACEYSPSPPTLVRLSDLAFLAAGSLVYHPDDGSEDVVYDLGDMAWIISATALVWIMTPGLGFFYSGLLRRKNALSMIFLSVGVLAVVSFQVSLRLSLCSHFFLIIPCPVVLVGLLARLL